MVPALADIRALRRLGHGMQAQATSQLFQVMEILADGSFRPQPTGFWRAHWRCDLDLNQLGGSGHPFDFIKRLA